MSEELQAAAIELARDALQKFETERDIAKHIKVRDPNNNKNNDKRNSLTHHNTHSNSIDFFVFVFF